MTPDDPRVRDFLGRSMTMRVATLAPSGMPHLTPLRFVDDGRALYAITRADSPAVRHIRTQPGVVLLFDAEESGPSTPVLRVRAQASIRADADLMRWLEGRAARKYFLRPGGLWNMVTHWRSLPAWLHNRRAGTPDNRALVTFALDSAEFLDRPS